MSNKTSNNMDSTFGANGSLAEKVKAEDNMDSHKEEFFKFLNDKLNENVSDENIRVIKSYYNKLEECKNSYELISIRLGKEINRQALKCESLERSRSSLRSTIKKASENWSERKAQISEYETEQTSDGVNYSKLSVNNEAARCNSDFDIFIELKYKSEQLELSERRADDMNKRLKDYEKLIDDQEIIIHGLKEQLDTYFSDNLKMSRQLAELDKLFQEIEATNHQEVHSPNATAETSETADTVPSQEELNAISKSVSKTYIKLKELIYEKKSLVTEIERLKVLNVELQLRVSQQENRLVSVSDALQSTWLIVSNLKDEHAKIHTEESILRYDLKEKREILHKLREELEWAREQWHKIRRINSESEDEWTNLRKDLDDRKKCEEEGTTDKNNSSEVKPTLIRESSFEPPIDLLLDMGIEYGVIDADDDEPATGIALIHGEDVHNERLRDLEEQCCYLYQKLMTSTTRALGLASRLTSLHEHYSMSEEEEEEDEEEEEEEYEDLFEDNNNDILYESSIVSQDSESNDTAYVSEADGPDSTEPSSSLIDNQESNLQDEAASYGSSPEDGYDVLSKRLINYLPKKIEILSNENKILEKKLIHLQEEKNKSDAGMKSVLDFEKRQRRKLEEQLSHLGKCVDELNLERNGKIEKAEVELKRKIEEIDNEQKEHEKVIEELESLKEQYCERGEILQLTALQLQQADSRSVTAEEALSMFKKELDDVQSEMNRLKETQYEVKAESQRESTAETKSILKTDISEKADISFGTDDQHSVVATIDSNELVSPSTENCSIRLQPEIVVFTPEVVITKDSIFRLPFHLLPNTKLHWAISVQSEEITFGITYTAETSNKKIMKSETNQLSLPSAEVCFSVDLISPVTIRALESPSKGKLITKISGHYCLSFKNILTNTQFIRYKVWIQNEKDNR